MISCRRASTALPPSLLRFSPAEAARVDGRCQSRPAASGARATACGFADRYGFRRRLTTLSSVVDGSQKAICRLRTRRGTAQSQIRTIATSEDSSHIPITPAVAANVKLGIRDRLRKLKLERDRTQQGPVTATSVQDRGSDILEAQDMAEENDIDEKDIEAYMRGFDDVIEDYNAQDSSKFRLNPGDLVETSGSGSSSSRLAIYLRTINHKIQYFTVNGTVSFASYQNALMVVPGFVDAKMLESILEYVPIDYSNDIGALFTDYAGNVPREIGAPFTDKLAEFHAQSEQAYRAHASKLDNAHGILAHPTRYTYMSLEDAASKLTGIPNADLSAPLLLVVSNCLIRSEFGFNIQNRTYVYTRMLGIDSKETADAVHRVVRWVRAYQERQVLGVGGIIAPPVVIQDATNLDHFLKKAIELVKRSRELRLSSPDGVVLKNKSLSDISGEPDRNSVAFNRSDQDIIKFLMLLLSTKAYFFHPTLRSIPSVILRATGMYPDVDLDADMVHAFMVEIGAMQPFQDANAFDREIQLCTPELTAQLQRVEELISRGEDPRVAANLVDSMQGLRKDWGDLPVFCIDPEDASDRDDGISIEDVPGEPDQYWLHVHVVHLSAFMTPDHLLARLARTQLQAIYLTEGRVPMLPTWVAGSFGLARDAPVMTISTRLDTDGKQLECKVQAGVIRNVVKLNLEAVDSIFGHKDRDHLKLNIAVGDVESPQSFEAEHAAPMHVSEEHQDILTTLFNLTLRLNKNRAPEVSTGASIYGRIRLEGVDASRGSVFMDSLPKESHFSTEDPSIALYNNVNYENENLDPERRPAPSRLVVEESMLQAGASVAEWAGERKIPIPYWGTGQNVGGLDIEAAALREKIKNMRIGRIPFERDEIQYFRRLFLSSSINAEPTPHRTINLESYTKITSPLRRYLDLVGQWQVDAEIRREAAQSAGNAQNPTRERKEADKSTDSEAADLREGSTSNVPLASNPSPQTESASPAESPTNNLTASAGAPATLDHPHLPFAVADIRDNITNWRWRNQLSTRFIASHLKHWRTLAVARAFYLNEFALPDHLEAVLFDSGGTRRRARIESLELQCDTEDAVGESGERAAEGDRWVVRIRAVKVHSKRIILSLVRKISSREST